MYIPYNFGKCIVCTERAPGDPEHVIPQVIGGRLTARLLCNKCNHDFGSEITSRLKTDASIRLAVEDLKDAIPEFARRYLDRAEYVARAEDGSQVRLSRSGDSLRVLAGEGADHSILLASDEALGAIATKLKRAGLPGIAIRDYQERFLMARENEPIGLPTNETFVKRSLQPPVPNLALDHLDERFWILLSLEFVALLIGKEIFRSSLDDVRSSILRLEESVPMPIAHYSAGSRYGPFHVVRLIADYDILAVEIRLFRWLVTHVKFDWIEYEGPHPVYFEDLEDRRSYFAPDLKYAEQNKWVRF